MEKINVESNDVLIIRRRYFLTLLGIGPSKFIVYGSGIVVVFFIALLYRVTFPVPFKRMLGVSNLLV